VCTLAPTAALLKSQQFAPAYLLQLWASNGVLSQEGFHASWVSWGLQVVADVAVDLSTWLSELFLYIFGAGVPS
jgi:hypothetical protein